MNWVYMVGHNRKKKAVCSDMDLKCLLRPVPLWHMYSYNIAALFI